VQNGTWRNARPAGGSSAVHSGLTYPAHSSAAIIKPADATRAQMACTDLPALAGAGRGRGAAVGRDFTDRQRLAAMLDGGVGLGNVHGPWGGRSGGDGQGARASKQLARGSSAQLSWPSRVRHPWLPGSRLAKLPTITPLRLGAPVLAKVGHSRNQNRPLTKNPARGNPQTGFSIWRSQSTPRETWEEPECPEKVYRGEIRGQVRSLAEAVEHQTFVGSAVFRTRNAPLIMGP
jgi:hypothetical protein